MGCSRSGIAMTFGLPGDGRGDVVMFSNAANRSAFGISVCLVGVCAVVGAALVVWPTSSTEPRVSSDRHEGHDLAAELRTLRIDLALSKRALARERHLAEQLQRELRDASRQIDELARSAEKLRIALKFQQRKDRADARNQRARFAPHPSGVWRTASSGVDDLDGQNLPKPRAQVRPDARISPYTSGLRMLPPRRQEGGQIKQDERSRLAPMAAIAPAPMISSAGSPEQSLPGVGSGRDILPNAR